LPINCFSGPALLVVRRKHGSRRCGCECSHCPGIRGVLSPTRISNTSSFPKEVSARVFDYR
jgi:hypothetical protein